MTQSRDIRKIRRWDVDTFNMSSENISTLNCAVPSSTNNSDLYFAKPITFTKRRQQRRSFAQNGFDEIKKQHRKGLVFIWPRKKTFVYEREYGIAIKLLAHLLYWLNQFGFFPSGIGVPIERPPWSINPPLTKPENRDYIIEPDWNSVYLDG